MTEPLFECVPNISEGRRTAVIEALADAVASVTDETLIDRHSDASHNRSVFTLAGEGHALVEAVVRLARVAVEQIDLREHEGAHPRIGALDVVPFVPLAGATMDQAVTISNVCGRRLAEELDLPIYYYGESAFRSEYRELPAVRAGSFEQLSDEVDRRAPDIGPERLHPTAGATAVGARKPLVAYNVNLSTTDVDVARHIAETIRTVPTTMLSGTMTITWMMKLAP